MGHVSEGVSGDFVSIASGEKAGFDFTIGQDAQENFGILREAQARSQALVASGGCQPPITPLYEFFRLADPQAPVEDYLTAVQAPRGGIRHIVSPNTSAALTDARTGLDKSTKDRDYSGSTVQDTSGPKSVAKVDCPSVNEEYVVAVSQIIEFDNLQYRIFPEQVAAFQEDVAVAFASKKEVFYLDYINTHSTAVTSDYDYGASRSILRDWTLAATAYRKRHGMARTATLVFVCPDWAMEALRLDMALNADGGLDLYDVTDARILAALSARNIQPVWYNDAPTAASTQKFDGAQTTGALNGWPATVTAYIHAPGTFVRLDGGTLDLGLVRDSALNGTNDLQLFMEEWIGAAMLGLESVKLTSSITVNGAAPTGVTAATS
jgi:hypothetical protein